MNKLIIAAAFFCTLATLTSACGCYGPTSCTTDGKDAAVVNGTRTGQCDCCPVCNTCEQLFIGCAAGSTSNTLIFIPALASEYVVGQNIGMHLINTTSQPSAYLFGPEGTCVDHALPAGIYFTNISADGNYYLTGTPTVATPSTSYKIIIKGSLEHIFTTTVTFSVKASGSSPSASTSGAAAPVSASSTSGVAAPVSASSTSGASAPVTAPVSATSTGADAPVSAPVSATSTGASAPVVVPVSATSTGVAAPVSAPVSATSTGASTPVVASSTSGAASSTPVAASTSSAPTVSAPASGGVNNAEDSGSNGAQSLTIAVAASIFAVVLAL